MTQSQGREYERWCHGWHDLAIPKSAQVPHLASPCPRSSQEKSPSSLAMSQGHRDDTGLTQGSGSLSDKLSTQLQASGTMRLRASCAFSLLLSTRTELLCSYALSFGLKSTGKWQWDAGIASTRKPVPSPEKPYIR